MFGILEWPGEEFWILLFAGPGKNIGEIIGTNAIKKSEVLNV